MSDSPGSNRLFSYRDSASGYSSRREAGTDYYDCVLNNQIGWFRKGYQLERITIQWMREVVVLVDHGNEHHYKLKFDVGERSPLI